MKIIDLISIFLLMIVSGGWIAVMAVFAPAYRLMSPATYIEADKLNAKRACKHFAPTLILAAIFTFLSMLSHGPISTLPHLLSGASAFLIIGTGIFVKVKVLPINHEIESWSPVAPPDGWQEVRSKWVRYHNVRTVLGATAFLLQAVAVIWW